MSSSRDVPRARIVVADDDSDMRDLIGIVLHHRGFEVVGVADGQTAVTTILSEGADAVVSDLQMPGLDGLALCRVLRTFGASAALPFIVFTGVAEDDPRLAALRDINDVQVLRKPMGLRQITPMLLAMIPTPAGAAPTLSHVLGKVRGDTVWREHVAHGSMLEKTQAPGRSGFRRTSSGSIGISRRRAPDR